MVHKPLDMGHLQSDGHIYIKGKNELLIQDIFLDMLGGHSAAFWD
jgi:hypothetical protein